MTKHFTRRTLVGILLALFLICACFFAAGKGYSLYNSLCRKIDYTNNTVYAIHETVDRVYQSVQRDSASYTFDYGWAKRTPALVAHALGGIQDYTYTNSLEAFEHNYALGHRVFEVDFDITDEYIPVASHDKARWQELTGAAEGTPYTHSAFISHPVLSKYTPLDYRDIIDLMVRHPDIYVITDTKYSDHSTFLVQFSQLVKYASEAGGDVLDRIIPQAYHQDMIHWIMSVYPFKSVILTLYSSAIDPQTAYTICEQTGVRYITAPEAWITSDAMEMWDRLGIIVAAHTVNDCSRMENLRKLGVDIIYTDFLSPADL